MNIAICDDEPKMLEDIRELVRSKCPDASIELYSSGEEVLGWYGLP